ncbi:hypothetical protein ACIQXQ_01725 [Peribacillus sp. NPDC097198]|uniref:hypothetical protein n=1 Tax=Peribacillus sp. NPDC097198 TaxID=3364397 RepID=UPI0037FEB3D6
MVEPLKNECVTHFLNMPSNEQLLFILNQKIDQHLQDKYQLAKEDSSRRLNT